MPLIRKLIATEMYREHRIDVRHLGPDLLAIVDDSELSAFYTKTQFALEAGQRHVDYLEREKEKARG